MIRSMWELSGVSLRREELRAREILRSYSRIEITRQISTIFNEVS